MKKVLGIVALGALMSAPALATPVLGGSLQTQLTTAGAIVDVNADQYGADQLWYTGATGLSVARIRFELSAYSGVNSFGIYDVYDTDTRLTIFSGSDGAGAFGFLMHPSANTFCTATIATIATPSCADFDTNRFGFFLNAGSGYTFFSESYRNQDGVDHLVAYQGGPERGTLNGSPWLQNEFLLGWEDIYGGGDRDYDDFAVMVESVVGVSEPASLALFGFGLLALSMVARKRRRLPFTA